ncbi:TolC family protein [Pseudoflavitalea sp. X16]|uniref:TolC family protein n=1 Tax=Paraflavitalea devenefica TaxID=2716334 RepID=UPI001423850F|nr:TolC family protein [Paraflavitalea devenefica]NII28031.1 TolC family protein [Paraflavitalea devenefica]
MKPGKAMLTCYAVALMSLNSLAQTTPITLKQCVETAIANNIDVKQRDLQMQRSAVGWKQGKANLLPSLNGSVNHNLNQGRSIDPTTNSYVNQSYTSATYSLNADLTLFNGLRLINNLKARQYDYEASRLELQQQKDNLTLDVILAYLEILTNIDLLEQAKKQESVSRQQVERLEIMHKEGAIKPSDLYDLKGQLADNKLAIINSGNNLNAAKLRLAQLMNVPYNDALQVERLTAEQFAMDYQATPDSIYQVATEQLALVKAANLRQKSAEKDVKAARGALFPTIGIGGGIDTRFSSTGVDTSGGKVSYYDQLSNNYSTGVGIGVSIPILNGLQRRNQVALAKIDQKQAEYTAQTTQIQLKQNIERDHFNMEASLNKYQALVDQVGSYTENFRIAEVRFNEGASTSVEYLLAKNNLDRSNTNLIIQRYDYVLRTKILDYYQGKMMW